MRRADITLPRRDENHTVRALHSVNCCCRGIFQDVQRFDFIRINAVEIGSLHTVHHDERLRILGKGAHTTDKQIGEVLTRSAASLRSNKTRHPADKHIGQVSLWCLYEIILGNRGNCTCDTLFPLFSIAYDNHIRQGKRRFTENHIHHIVSRQFPLLEIKAKAVEDKHTISGSHYTVPPGFICHRSIGCTFLEYTDPGKRFPIRIRDCSGNLTLFLHTGIRRLLSLRCPSMIRQDNYLPVLHLERVISAKNLGHDCPDVCISECAVHILVERDLLFIVEKDKSIVLLDFP